MSDTVIRVENLSKKYTLHHLRQKARGLRHVLEDTISGPLRAVTNWARQNAEKRSGSGDHATVTDSEVSAPSDEEFWALKDVCFELKLGEVLGIIGRNGSGKSTLLKILSRITEPTTGRIEIDGRVASLLEVGTGFHQELTGRENIFLNGAILGMTRAEVRTRFDEIVAFSEVEKFLDTPVKRYSSGMYVRLAFAVAAHLEPEILIVDEVLAVGDAQFQEKCLGKMKDVAGNGRTVIFVSHNMSAVRTLCSSALVLADGKTDYSGEIRGGISHYSRSSTTPSYSNFAGDKKKPASIRAVSVASANPFERSVWAKNEIITLNVEFEVNHVGLRLDASARLESQTDGYIHTSFSSRGGVDLNRLTPGGYTLSFRIRNPGLLPGNYRWSVWLHDPMKQLYDLKEGAVGVESRDAETNYAYLGSSDILGPILADAECELRASDFIVAEKMISQS